MLYIQYIPTISHHIADFYDEQQICIREMQSMKLDVIYHVILDTSAVQYIVS